MKSFWDRFFKFLENRLPGLLLAFGFGYSKGKKKLVEKEKELRDEELKRKEAENKLEIIDRYSDMSDADIIDSALNGSGKKRD